MPAYFSVLVPYVPREHATEWHPTEPEGPWCVLTRGAFKSAAEAIAWGRAKLAGTPYSVRRYRSPDEREYRNTARFRVAATWRPGERMPGLGYLASLVGRWASRGGTL